MDANGHRTSFLILPEPLVLAFENHHGSHIPTALALLCHIHVNRPDIGIWMHAVSLGGVLQTGHRRYPNSHGTVKHWQWSSAFRFYCFLNSQETHQRTTESMEEHLRELVSRPTAAFVFTIP